MNFPLIKEELNIKGLKLRNRIVMPPMATTYAVNGGPGQDTLEYYDSRSKKTGLIIEEHAYISENGKARKEQLSMAHDHVINQYKKLTQKIHEKGAAIFAQINHAGAAAKDIEGAPLNVNTMTVEEINQIRDDFIAAAKRVKEAGFDGVEIHAAHGYLLSQFYSPLTNERDDDYGGNLDARIRLHLEVIKGVRLALGPDYPIAIRFGAWDIKEGGAKKEDIPYVCKKFEEAGVDLIDITGGIGGYIIPGRSEAGWFSDLSKLAKASTSVPIILTGGITEPQEAEELLEKGLADLIGVGRAMLKEARWTEQIYEG